MLILLETPMPPTTTSAPVSELVLPTLLLATILPDAIIVLPTFKLPAIPTPPRTTTAPVSIDVDGSVDTATMLLFEFEPILVLAYCWNAPTLALA